MHVHFYRIFFLILASLSFPLFPWDTVSLSSLQWPLQAYALDLEEQVSQITLKIDKSQLSLGGFVSSSVLLGIAVETKVSVDSADRVAFGFGLSHFFMTLLLHRIFLKRGFTP